jgi:hypothetical protein
MKKQLLIITLTLLTLSIPAFTHAQNYVEGEVIVKYKNAEFQTTAQGIQLILPSSPSPAPINATLAPLSLTPSLPPCKVNEPLEATAEELLTSPQPEEETALTEEKI